MDFPEGDHVFRAMTEDDNFRVITANTTTTVTGALAAQRVDVPANPRLATHFADLLTGTVLIRETMSPGHRVQGILKGPGDVGDLVADTHPDGLTRGLVQVSDRTTPFEVREGTQLQMMRSMARGVHRSVVEAPAGGDISRALMTYMQESEQIVTMIACGVRFAEGHVKHAGGFVVQLLPGAARGPLMIMTERLEGFPPIAELIDQVAGSPLALMDELLYQMPYAQLAASPVRFGCLCSRQAVVASLAAIQREELLEMVGDGVIELTCDYCNTEYAIGRQHLQGLLDPS